MFSEGAAETSRAGRPAGLEGWAGRRVPTLADAHLADADAIAMHSRKLIHIEHHLFFPSSGTSGSCGG